MSFFGKIKAFAEEQQGSDQTEPQPHSQTSTQTPHHDTTQQQQQKQAPSYEDVKASAETVLEAAQGKGDGDKGELAGAASNMLGAASTYGHLKDQPYGQNVGKAEDYLHSYEEKQSSSAPSHAAPHASGHAKADASTTDDY